MVAFVEPVVMGKDTITRLNRAGTRENNVNLKLVDECRAAIGNMPDGKSGVVVGSGPNTEAWRGRGWQTIDVNPTAGADFVVDANHMVTVLGPKSRDFVCAEYVTFDIQ